MRTPFIFFFSLAFLTTAVPAVWAQSEATGPFVAPRELVILKPATDQIWGNWVVAVINRGTTAQAISFKAHLPRETVDFQISEGLEPKDLKLEDDGVTVQKSFNPGVNVVSIAFAVKGENGAAKLTFKATRPIPEMIFMTGTGMLKLQGDNLKFQETDVQDGQKNDVFTLNQPVPVGENLVLQLSGIPEGRSRLWWSGGIFAAVLVLGASFLAWKTLPKNSKEKDGAYV